MKKLLLAGIYAFLLFAPLVVIYYSMSPSVVLQVPASELTLKWYANLLDQPRLVRGIGVSTLVASLSTVLALIAGIPAAFALTRGRFRGRGSLSVFFLSPLVLPGLVLALGLLMVTSYAIPSVIGTVWPLLGAHLLVTVPWVIRAVSASLEISDPDIEDAARGLGASPFETFLLVTLPSIRPGVLAGALFAFIVSFGNFALSLFFASGTVTTLPVAIFEYMDQFQDPTVAAASSLVILGTGVLAVIAARLRGMQLP